MRYHGNIISWICTFLFLWNRLTTISYKNRIEKWKMKEGFYLYNKIMVTIQKSGCAERGKYVRLFRNFMRIHEETFRLYS